MSTNQKKFIDRLQFLGVIGPFVVLLTLFAVLLNGTSKSWYLFTATLIGLPVCWKWGFKGFLITMGVLVVSFLALFSFFSMADRFWQLGATASLLIGLFTTHLGFEEIKGMMGDLQLESQSRLTNLIELDDQFNKSKKAWDMAEEEFNVQLVDKDQLIDKLSMETESLEQATLLIEKELLKLQSEHRRFHQELEKMAQDKSKLQVEKLQLTESLALVNQQMSLSQSEREQQLYQENSRLDRMVIDLEQKLVDLEQQLENQAHSQMHLESDSQEKEKNLKKMESALKENVTQLYDLKEKLMHKELDIKHQQERIEQLVSSSQAKEHQIIDFKEQIIEKERRVFELNQRGRDLELDLQTLNIHQEALLQKIKKLEEEALIKEQQIRQKGLEKDQLLKQKNHEIEQLYLELEEKGREFNAIVEQNKQVSYDLENQQQEIITLKEEKEAVSKLGMKELTELNDARFALFQAQMDIERLKKELSSQPSRELTLVQRKKHWLFELEHLLKQDKLKKADLEHLPKDLSNEILTLNQSKSIYKQLRMQFEEKSKVLEEVREQLFKTETQLELLEKEKEQGIKESTLQEKELEQHLIEKDREISLAESEVKQLNEMVSQLIQELYEKEKIKS